MNAQSTQVVEVVSGISACRCVMVLGANWIKKAEAEIVVIRAENCALLFLRILKCRAKVR